MAPLRHRRKLGARPYKNYSHEMLALAMEMVKTKKMTSYDAEKNFNIPRRTIEKKIQNIHSNKPGPPFRLTQEEELNFVKVLIVASEYGAPLTKLDLRILVHEYLKKNGRTDTFDNKVPGDWWAMNFIKRHRDKLSLRAVQNIKKTRAEKTKTEFEQYFNNLESVLENVPQTHVLNYDETNFSDDPGSVKCIIRRGTKYPERVMNSSKGCISVMFAATAKEEVMPPYIVYKAESLWLQWVEGGPKDARFNRTKSGWFDSVTYYDWFNSIIVPWARKLEGPKVVIGDNLSSHINAEVINLCEKYDIRFVLLPPNSTHITQPLDVAFFGPLKKVWRKILTSYKYENPQQSGLNKSHFPLLLAKVMDEVNMNKTENVISGFKATGIIPFNPQKVYKRIPECLSNVPNFTVDQTLLEYLKENRKPKEIKRGRNKKLNVEPGKSITTSDLNLNKTHYTKQMKKRSAGILLGMKDENFDKGTLVVEEDINSDARIEDYNGKTSNIYVNICGTLSDDELSYNKDLVLDNEAISKRKLSLKDYCSKENKKTKKRSKRIVSGSTTTEDTEWTEHSDDIEVMELADFEEVDSEVDEDVSERVDMIEKQIFEKIANISKETEDINEPETREIQRDRTDSKEKNELGTKKFTKIKEKNQRDVRNETKIKKWEDNKNKQECTENEPESRENSVGHFQMEEQDKIEEEQITMQQEKVNINKIGWNEGDTILARYFLRKWKYYVGIIRNVNKYEKIYSVAYYKLIRNKDDTSIKFVIPKRADEDKCLPETAIVKNIELLQISEHPKEYILKNDEDHIFFD